MAIKHGIKQIIYISATSIYPSQNQIAKESDPLDAGNTGNLALFNAEKILREDKTYDLTIVRFGGLLGDDRIPGKYFSGKENVAGQHQRRKLRHGRRFRWKNGRTPIFNLYMKTLLISPIPVN